MVAPSGLVPLVTPQAAVDVSTPAAQVPLQTDAAGRVRAAAVTAALAPAWTALMEEVRGSITGVAPIDPVAPVSGLLAMPRAETRYIVTTAMRTALQSANDLAVHGPPRDQKAVALALSVVNARIPYSWGGGNLVGATFGINGPGLGGNDSQVRGMDCSAFTRFVVFQAYGIEIPRTSGAQYIASRPVLLAAARAGDLVFQPGNQDAHVQLYIGGGKIAEQYQSGTTARVIDLPPGSEIRRPNGL
jgi:cell wall-associated NlpC family hydrolase